MPLVAVLLPAASAPRDEPRSRVRVTKDLMMAILVMCGDQTMIARVDRISYYLRASVRSGGQW